MVGVSSILELQATTVSDFLVVALSPRAVGFTIGRYRPRATPPIHGNLLVTSFSQLFFNFWSAWDETLPVERNTLGRCRAIFVAITAIPLFTQLGCEGKNKAEIKYFGIVSGGVGSPTCWPFMWKIAGASQLSNGSIVSRYRSLRTYPEVVRLIGSPSD